MISRRFKKHSSSVCGNAQNATLSAWRASQSAPLIISKPWDGPEILNSIDRIEKADKVAQRTFGLDDIQATGQITLNVLNVQGDMNVERP